MQRLFGHNAPNYTSSPHRGKRRPNWEDYTLASIPTPGLPWVDLDNVYPVVTGSWVALEAYTTPPLTVSKSHFSVLPKEIDGMVGSPTRSRRSGSPSSRP